MGARCWAEGDYEGKAIGLRRGDQPAHEVSLEKTMDRKKRVPTIMGSRNGLQQMHNSDAANSNPEYLKYWIGPKYWAGQGFYWQQEGGARAWRCGIGNRMVGCTTARHWR